MILFCPCGILPVFSEAIHERAPAGVELHVDGVVLQFLVGLRDEGLGVFVDEIVDVGLRVVLVLAFILGDALERAGGGGEIEIDVIENAVLAVDDRDFGAALHLGVEGDETEGVDAEHLGEGLVGVLEPLLLVVYLLFLGGHEHHDAEVLSRLLEIVDDRLEEVLVVAHDDGLGVDLLLELRLPPFGFHLLPQVAREEEHLHDDGKQEGDEQGDANMETSPFADGILFVAVVEEGEVRAEEIGGHLIETAYVGLTLRAQGGVVNGEVALHDRRVEDAGRDGVGVDLVEEERHDFGVVVPVRLQEIVHLLVHVFRFG